MSHPGNSLRQLQSTAPLASQFQRGVVAVGFRDFAILLATLFGHIFGLLELLHLLADGVNEVVEPESAAGRVFAMSVALIGLLTLV